MDQPVPIPDGSDAQQALLATLSGAGPSDPYGWSHAAASPERQRHEREQAYFNEVYLLAPVAYFVLGFDGAILQVNLAGADLLGIDRQRSAQVLLRSHVSAQFLAEFDDFVRHALNSSEPHDIQRMQLTLLRSAEVPEAEPEPGQQRNEQRNEQPGLPVSLLASVDSSGQALRVMVEPAEGKLAALERSEERFRRIVHSAEEGIWELDATALTSFVNPKMALMLGYRIEEMLGQPLVAFMDQEGRAILERNIAQRQQGQQGRAGRHEFKFLRNGGAEMWATLVTKPIFDGAGAYLGALALVNDITESRASSERIWRHANFDALTGLPNQHMFVDRLRNEARKAKREGRFLALLVIDIDQFQRVSDSLGRDKGDLLLSDAARRIAASIRASDAVARVNGNQFAVILSGFEQLAAIERVAQEIIDALVRPFALDGEHAQVSASVGIALYPADAGEADSLLRHAGSAMHAARQAGAGAGTGAGAGRYAYYTPAVQAAAQLRLRTTSDLRLALQAGQLEIHYQPIVELCSGAILRAEALLRWRHPQRGLLSPVDFLQYAESGGLIAEIGDWVLREAVRQVKYWQQTLDPGFQICINKSPLEFRSDAAFYQGWAEHMAQQGLLARSIVIDITEGVLLDETRGVPERLRQLRAMGLELALDDFGTGYASLACLRNFDIDYLKIDPSFVHAMADGELALCEAIIALAHKLGLRVVAEGVETEQQRALLAGAGCDDAQGHLFSPALLPQQLALLIKAGQACQGAANLET